MANRHILKQKHHTSTNSIEPSFPEYPLSFFACPNPDCADFNRFAAGNLSVAERMGKNKAIRRLYCKTCGGRFSEREGSLMRYTKLPEVVVVRIIKCLGHGCSVEATADLCEVDPRTVERLLEKAGTRAQDFHRLQLERLQRPPEAVQLDELHARVAKSASDGEKKGRNPELPALARLVQKVARGFTRRWM
jgi:transposase-like protein